MIRLTAASGTFETCRRTVAMSFKAAERRSSVCGQTDANDPERTFLGHRLDWKQRADHFTAPSFLGAANAELRKRLWLAVQAALRIETEPAANTRRALIL